MRWTLYCLAIVLAVSLIPVLDAATTTQPASETPAYMAGLDPKGSGAPEELVRRRWNAVMRVLKDEKLNVQTKEARVVEIVTPVFDFTAITRLSLGRTNWRKFSAAQRKEFSDLFVRRMRQTYGKRIAGYGGEKVVFKPALPPKKPKSISGAKPAGGPRTVHVPVEILSKSRKWTILHKFRRIGELYRVYDIEIEGVSILRSFRSQFNDILRRGTPEDVLARLRKQLSTQNKTPTGKGPARP